jgi:hypothetical protein
MIPTINPAFDVLQSLLTMVMQKELKPGSILS